MSINPETNADFPEIPGLDGYIDLEEGLGRIRGNRKVYKSLLQSFANKNNMESLKEQVAANNLEEAAKTVHSIKGVSANLSLSALNKSMVELEAQIKAGSYNEKTYRDSLDHYDKTISFISMLMQQL